MKKSTFLGSTLSVLLLFSVISYSRTLIQQQNPKSTQPTAQVNAPSATEASTTTDPTASAVSIDRGAPVAASTATTTEKPAISELFTATAYSLRGRTASGAAPVQGIIAADPRVLPIGSRVRIEAGSYTGEYVVADTGGTVRGHRIDIWTPTAREAMHFGRRTVKLTILQLGGKRGRTAASPRKLTVSPSSGSPDIPNPQKQ